MSEFNPDEVASLRPMLQGDAGAELQLTSHVSRWFFGRFHQAHVHVYELDVPVNEQAAVNSSGSVASHALQDLQTSAAGLYVAFNSDTGLLEEDSAVMHESPQAEHPRILLASLVSRRGEERRTRYAPLIPLPSTLTTSDLHPWNTAMHSTKIPFALVASHTNTQGLAVAAADALIYLQPRYSQYHAICGGGDGREMHNHKAHSRGSVCTVLCQLAGLATAIKWRGSC